MSKKEIEEAYAISRRIEGEERALEAAISVTTSTQQEIDEQWNLYDGCARHACARSGSGGPATEKHCCPDMTCFPFQT